MRWPLSLFEPTCANARWALMSRFASVCLHCRGDAKKVLVNYDAIWCQRSHWPGSNEGPKERQVGSHQRQVASLTLIL